MMKVLWGSRSSRPAHVEPAQIAGRLPGSPSCLLHIAGISSAVANADSRMKRSVAAERSREFDAGEKQVRSV